MANTEKKKKYEYFFQEFREPYQPKMPFCPTVVIARIEKYWGVDYAKATEIYRVASSYLGSISRMNDFLYEQIVINAKTQ